MERLPLADFTFEPFARSTETPAQKSFVLSALEDRIEADLEGGAGSRALVGELEASSSRIWPASGSAAS